MEANKLIRGKVYTLNSGNGMTMDLRYRMKNIVHDKCPFEGTDRDYKEFCFSDAFGDYRKLSIERVTGDLTEKE